MSNAASLAYEKKHNVYLISVSNVSDGNYATPSKTLKRTQNDRHIEQVLGKMWMEERLKEGTVSRTTLNKDIALKGLQAEKIEHELERLPPGFSAWQSQRIEAMAIRFIATRSGIILLATSPRFRSSTLTSSTGRLAALIIQSCATVSLAWRGSVIITSIHRRA